MQFEKQKSDFHLFKFLKSNKFRSILDQAIISGSTFIIGYTAAIKFDHYEFGIFAFLISISNYLYTFHAAIVTQPYQLLVKYHSKSGLFNTGSAITIIYILTFSIIFIGYCIININLDQYLIINFIIFCSLNTFYEFYRRILQSDLNYKKLILIDCISYLSKAIVICMFFITQSNIKINIVFFISNIFLVTPLIVLAYIHYERIIMSLKSSINFSIFLSEGKWLLGNSLMVFMSSQIYTFILAGYRSVEEVGIMAAVLMPLGLLRPIFISAEGYLVSFVSKKEKTNQWASFKKEAFFFIFPLFGVMLLMIIFPSTFLYIFFKEKYLNYQEIFRLACIYTILNMILSFLSFFLRIQFKSKQFVKASIIAIALTTPWGIPLVIKHGLISVFIVTSTTTLFTLIQILYFINNEKSKK